MKNEILINGRAVNYDKFKKRIGHSLRKLGFESEQEDASQVYFLKLLEGKSEHQTIDQFVIDYLRVRYGASRSPYFEQRKNFEKTLSLDTWANKHQDGFIEIKKHESEDNFWAMISYCKSREDRDLAILHYYWGFKLREIGEMYDISESHVCQKLRIILVEIKNGIKKHELKRSRTI